MDGLPEVFFAPNYARIPMYQVGETTFDEWDVIPAELKNRIIEWNEWFLDNFDHEAGWKSGVDTTWFAATYQELTADLEALNKFTVTTNYWWQDCPYRAKRADR